MKTNENYMEICNIGYQVYLNKAGKLIFLVISLICLTRLSAWAQNLYLSNLSASADDPLYVFYASPPNRTDRMIDPVYKFQYFLPNQGSVFGDEKFGFLSMAFRINDDIRYLQKDYSNTPRIKSSYSDLVKYEFSPYQNVNVTSHFQVYSSHWVIQDMYITNNKSNAISLEVYPFFQHPDRLNEIKLSADSSAFTFKTYKSADGWALAHQLPHVDSLMNIFAISESPQSFGAYPALGPLDDEPTLQKKYIQNSSSIIESGMIYYPDQTKCTEIPPTANYVIYHADNKKEIITEKAVTANIAATIPGDGTQYGDLGYFVKDPFNRGDKFSITLRCGNQQGTNTKIIPSTGDTVYTNIFLSDSAYIESPRNLQLEVSTGYEGVFLNWDTVSEATYKLYRGTHSNEGRYVLIADSLQGNSFFDTGLTADVAQTYVVIAQDSLDNISSHSNEVVKPTAPPPPAEAISFFDDVHKDTLSNEIWPYLNEVVGYQLELQLNPGATRHIRILRGLISAGDTARDMNNDVSQLMNYDISKAISEDEAAYSTIPDIPFENPDDKMVYWMAFNLLRQGIMPPSGALGYPYLVPSRKPDISWQHAGQSLAESQALLTYLLMDPQKAKEIQLNFLDDMETDGYISHRIGPDLRETDTMDGIRTSGPPYLNWVSWNIYKLTGDKEFLTESYNKGEKFYNYWITHRDVDNDGLSEWGGKADLESSRAGFNVTWNLAGDASKVEGLDLNLLLVREARSLANMSLTLGDTIQSELWKQKARQRAELINYTFWDEQTGFYYPVDRDDNDFTIDQTGDLKHKEISSYLALNANVAGSNQAELLLNSLTDNGEFWRSNGIATLSAKDSYYDPLGKWNGPVWLPWQLMVYEGLNNYSYTITADNQLKNVLNAVKSHLKDVHAFSQWYSPDSNLTGNINTYTSTAVIARMLYEKQQMATSIGKEPKNSIPHDFRLSQNYPNPFNPVTNIHYRLSKSGKVRLSVYNTMGQRIMTLVNKRQKAGSYTISFDAGKLSSGVYLYRLETKQFKATRKMILLK